MHSPRFCSPQRRCGVTMWAPWGLMRTYSPYMGHPALHSCADLSVYCYLPNSLLIATLLLPIYKPALLFLVTPPLFCELAPSSPACSLFAVTGLIQIVLSGSASCFGFTSITLQKSINRTDKEATLHIPHTCSFTRQEAFPGKAVFHLHPLLWVLTGRSTFFSNRNSRRMAALDWSSEEQRCVH